MWIFLPDMHANRDSMLKEKFWIDEDEPIAEEILVTSLQAAQEEEEEQQQVMGEVGWGGEGSIVHPAHTAAQPRKTTPREMLCQVRDLTFLNQSLQCFSALIASNDFCCRRDPLATLCMS